MNEIEKHMQHLIIKELMKRAIDNNLLLDPIQKEEQKVRVEACASHADRIEIMLSMIKYLGL